MRSTRGPGLGWPGAAPGHPGLSGLPVDTTGNPLKALDLELELALALLDVRVDRRQLHAGGHVQLAVSAEVRPADSHRERVRSGAVAAGVGAADAVREVRALLNRLRPRVDVGGHDPVGDVVAGEHDQLHRADAGEGA